MMFHVEDLQAVAEILHANKWSTRDVMGSRNRLNWFFDVGISLQVRSPGIPVGTSARIKNPFSLINPVELQQSGLNYIPEGDDATLERAGFERRGDGTWSIPLLTPEGGPV
jgi:hypothetical protein